jgi:hypothetical protein
VNCSVHICVHTSFCFTPWGEHAFSVLDFFCLRHYFANCSVYICANTCRFSACACCFLVDFSVHSTHLDFLSEILALVCNVRSRCSFAELGLAALSRRSVSLLYRDALVLAVAHHRDAIFFVACLHRLSFSSGSDTLVNQASDEYSFFMSGSLDSYYFRVCHASVFF